MWGALLCFYTTVVCLLACDLEINGYYFMLTNVFKKTQFCSLTVQVEIIYNLLRTKVIIVKINGKKYLITYTKKNSSFLKELEAKSEELFKQESHKSADLPIDIYINNLYDHH